MSKCIVLTFGYFATFIPENVDESTDNFKVGSHPTCLAKCWLEAFLFALPSVVLAALLLFLSDNAEVHSFY